MRRRMIIGGMVVLGVGYGAYRLTQTQVQQVEQHTGKKPRISPRRNLKAQWMNSALNLKNLPMKK